MKLKFGHVRDALHTNSASTSDRLVRKKNQGRGPQGRREGSADHEEAGHNEEEK